MQRSSTISSRSVSAASSMLSLRLPVPLDSMLGREYELAQLTNMLSRPEVRLLTLTGAAGVGKTRLALAVAHELKANFASGIYFVPLATISDPDLVVVGMAQALGLREDSSHPLFEKLQAAVGDQSVLLLLDNFEQVLAAAPLLADLLSFCPHLHLLVTSRAALRLQGEHEYAVFPLALPDSGQLSQQVEHLMGYAACLLFVQRAQAIKPDFHVTRATASTIAEICIRLDGLPLAIELAAARTRLLSLPTLLARLEHPLAVLTGGVRNVAARQQTLRATIAWSYYLLGAREQRLFRWIAIFVDGCNLQAAEAIAQAAGLGASDVLDGVSVLLENHLLRRVEQPDGEPRLLMLQTTREYGLECLASTGELEAAQAAHAAYYLQLAEEAEPQLRGAEQAYRVPQLEQEYKNLQAALSFLLEQAHLQAGTIELACARSGEPAFRSAWARGRSITPEKALITRTSTSLPAQLSPPLTRDIPLNKSTFSPQGLTAREMEVLRLVAAGQTNAQIAAHLVISSRTVDGHLTSIYSKLHVSSRTAAVHYASEHHLL